MDFAEDLRVFSAPFEEIRAAVIEILRDMRAKSIEWSRKNQLVTAHMPFGPFSLFTCGECITIAIDPSGEVWVQSQNDPVYGKYLDFGTNRSHCRMILNELARRLGDRR
jgi:hypothetical protein